MRANSVGRVDPLLRAAVANRLAEDDSPKASDLRGWLQSADSASLTNRMFMGHIGLIHGLRKIAAEAPPGNDEALRRSFAAYAEAAFAEASSALAATAQPPVIAAVLAQAESLLHTLYGLRIPKFGDDMIVLSQSGFASHFVGHRGELKEELNAELQAAGLPIQYNAIRDWPRATEKLIIGDQVFELLRGNTGKGRCCWGIALTEKGPFARAMRKVKNRLGNTRTWEEKDPTTPKSILRFGNDHLPLSLHGLGSHFVGNPKELKRELNAELRAAGLPIQEKDILNWPDASAELSIGDEKFTVLRGDVGNGYCCWGIALADKVRFSCAMREAGKRMDNTRIWEEKNPDAPKLDLKFGPEHFVLSGPGLESHFVGSAFYLKKELEEKLLVANLPIEEHAIRDWPQASATLTMDGQAFELLKGDAGSGRCCWGIALLEKEQFAKAMRWCVRVEDSELLKFGSAHLVFSVEKLASYFVGDGSRLKSELDAELQALGLPTEGNAIRNYPSAAAKITIKGRAFELLKGDAGSGKCCWGIVLTEKEQLGRVMGWSMRNPELLKFGLEHLVFSWGGLASHFVGKGPKLKRELDVELQAASLPTEGNAIRNYPSATAKLTINGEEFELLKGEASGHCCWGMASSEKGRLAKAMGWALRPHYKLQRVGKGEVPLTLAGMKKNFAGDPTENLARIKAAMSAGRPAEQESAPLPNEEFPG